MLSLLISFTTISLIEQKIIDYIKSFEILFLDQSTYGSPGKDAYNNGSTAAFKFNPMQGLGNAEVCLSCTDLTVNLFTFFS